jgi:hypothetical protein
MSDHQLPAERPRSAFSRLPESPQEDSPPPERNEKGQFTRDGYWSEERREAQREIARKMIAEGRFGGQNGFHRRKSKKFQEILAERAVEKANTFEQKLDAMIAQSRDKRLQLEAIREYRQMEEWATKNAREEERDYRDMTHDQLNTRLLEIMSEAMGLDMTGFLSEPIEGTATEESAMERMDALAREIAAEEEDEQDVGDQAA